MKKSILIAVFMALALFAYGYILSTAGHDHSTHSHKVPEDHHGHEH